MGGMYLCSKQGVLGLVRSMAKDMPSYKKEKVRMVGICPNGDNTALFAEAMSQFEARAREEPIQAVDQGYSGLLEPNELGGESGQMMVVMPGFRYYWPDWNLR